MPHAPHPCHECGRDIAALEDAPVIIDVLVSQVGVFVDAEEVPEWVAAMLALPPEERRRQLCADCFGAQFAPSPTAIARLVQMAERALDREPPGTRERRAASVGRVRERFQAHRGRGPIENHYRED